MARHTLLPCGPMENEMLTADPASDPRPSHTVKGVVISTAVNPKSHCGSQVINKAVTASRSAMQRATIAADALREAENLPFRVTVNGKLAMVPPPPAITPLIIPRDFPWPAADMARPVLPAITIN